MVVHMEFPDCRQMRRPFFDSEAQVNLQPLLDVTRTEPTKTSLGFEVHCGARVVSLSA
jgi:hypothetical protein